MYVVALIHSLSPTTWGRLVRGHVHTTTHATGPWGTLDFRLFFHQHTTQTLLSPWHNIPLYCGDQDVLHGVIEVPRGTTHKMEMAVDEPFNPVKQDERHGYPRFFRAGPLAFNYGFLPQTWEDPQVADPATGRIGDNDPLDLVEIGDRVAKMGEVLVVKPLGVLGLVDEDETDWKVLAINIEDPRHKHLTDVTSIAPAVLHSLIHWFRTYKIAEGKKENTYAFDPPARDVHYAWSVIVQAHNAWASLVREGREGLWTPPRSDHKEE